eukprot:TRINITY_DN1624_c0_g1_i3.p1 TRINITY_DN1624_c0_g1~~TRINITY_DN1624_c0_g1_i3.p1  ORF type:complete len:788 (+),score=138.75 TRINITY_DN1624_c0_g1_i3:44-2407(+)
MSNGYTQNMWDDDDDEDLEIKTEQDEEIINDMIQTDLQSEKTSFQLLQEILDSVLNTTTKLTSTLKTNQLNPQTLALVKDTQHAIELAKKRSCLLKPELGEPKDWNKLYQESLEVKSISTLEYYERLVNVARNFEKAAAMYGKIIISEVFWENKYKTIKSVEFGGIAGGRKYIHNGILFKFATDWKNIYGSDEAAMKTANCEMKGLMAVAEHISPDDPISLPLMTLVDYMGFRLIAQSLLPISNDTLVYGSSDGGHTVYHDNKEVNESMKKLAESMYLKSHMGGVHWETAKMIEFPTDIEVHIGRDGRRYMVDFARICPPTKVEEDPKTSYLYRQFRPEFLKIYSTPLSSDAFTKFQKYEKDKSTEADIREATQYLLNWIIPDFCLKYPKQLLKTISFDDLNYMIHQNGINIRYLAVVAKLLPSPYQKYFAYTEMVARAIKNHIREELRIVKQLHKALDSRTYHEVVIKCFNNVLGNTSPQESSNFWKDLRIRLQNQFLLFPTDEELNKELHVMWDRFAYAISSGICTYSVTSNSFVHQVYYKCFTCGLIEERGICEVCAETCHFGHNLSKPLFSNFFCDCGPKCKAQKDVEIEFCDEFDNNLRKKMAIFGFAKLFERVSSLAGIKLSQTALKDLKSNPRNFVFVLPDIIKLLCRTKHMTSIVRAEANILHLKSLKSERQERARLFPMALNQFEQSLQQSTNSSSLIKEYADAMAQQALYDESEIHYDFLAVAVKKYKELGDKESIENLINRINAAKEVTGIPGNESVDGKEVCPHITCSLHYITLH